MKNFFLILLVIGVMGCSRIQYESAPLESMKAKPKAEEKVAVLYKPLSRKDSMKYLGRDWQSKGCIPIQMMIENFSADSVMFVQEGISLPTIDYETIKVKAHQYTKYKAMGIAAPSATGVMLGLLGLLLSPATFGATGILVPIGLGGAGLHATSKMIQSDLTLDKDYQKKFLHDREISAGSVVEGIIFVPKKAFQEKFTLKMLDTKTEKVFVVEAKKLKN